MLHVRGVVVENVKSFRGEHRFDLSPGVNWFVGDNNSGKSTLMEALLFLFEGSAKWTPETFYSADRKGQTRVEADITGGVDELVSQEKFSRLASYVFEDKGERILRLDRSSENRQVVQSGKTKMVTVKQVAFWHNERQQFENVTGIDALVKSIFDFEAVWADAHPSEHIDFSSTKTLGRLLDSAFKRFTKTEQWQALSEAHTKAFSPDEEGSFLRETQELANGIKELVDEQYGSAAYRFNFGLPEASVFMKQGSLHVDDGAGETPVEGKGTGMQRAIALGIIQLYAKSSALFEENNPTPLILMLDEPETWLHPTAQLRLGDALSAIGKRDQVFIITHSPYLIRKFDTKDHLLTVLTGKGADRKIDPSTKFGLFGVGEPTWGEINYRAFGICSNDFHNELFGYIQWWIERKKNDQRFAGEGEIDEFLVQKGVARSKVWIRNSAIKDPRTLAVYIRNSIHHPENILNEAVSAQELEASTRELVRIVEDLPRLV